MEGSHFTSFHGPHTRTVTQKALVPKQLDFCPRTPKQSIFVSVFGLTRCGSGWLRRQRSIGHSKERHTPFLLLQRGGHQQWKKSKTFVGLSLMMGILCLPCRNDYWRGQERCWLAHTNFGKTMSRDCYNSLWHYLHLQANSQANFTGDKCTKIRWFVNYLVGRYLSAW